MSKRGGGKRAAQAGRQAKTPAETTSKPAMPALRRPRHGHGLIYTGGTPGNRGGSGAPPALVRSLAREVAVPALTELKERVTKRGKRLRVAELARIAGTVAPIGLKEPSEELLEAVTALEWALNRVIDEVLAAEPELAVALRRRLAEVLLQVLGAQKQRELLA